MLVIATQCWGGSYLTGERSQSATRSSPRLSNDLA